MMLIDKTMQLRNRGAVLIILLIFLLIFSTFAVSLASLSGSNVILAENQSRIDRARACAESGLEITRFWLSRVSISGTTSPTQRCSKMAYSLQNELDAQSITNMTASYDTS